MAVITASWDFCCTIFTISLGIGFVSLFYSLFIYMFIFKINLMLSFKYPVSMNTFIFYIQTFTKLTTCCVWTLDVFVF